MKKFNPRMRAILIVLMLVSYSSLFSQTWHPIGTGLNDGGFSLGKDASSNALLIGGNFTQSGGVFTPFISSLTGTTYSDMDNGFNAGVVDIITYNNETYVCGGFSLSGTDTIYSIAKWDTISSSWQSIVDTINGAVIDMIEYQGYLYIGGSFTQINGVNMSKTAKWNGSAWSPTFFTLPANQSFKMYEKDNGGILYYATYQTGSGDLLYKFNGFSVVGISSYPTYPPNPFYISALKSLSGILYIGSPYDGNSGYIDYIYSFDGVSFSNYNYLPSNTSTINLGSSGVSCLGERNGHLVVGAKPLSAAANGWLLEAVGGTFQVLATSDNGYFFDVLEHNYAYYTVGHFNNINGIAANNIARLTVPPPNVNFNTTTTNTCIGYNVTFNNTTTNGPASYQWSFPGGTPSSSTAINPTVTYNTVGNYDVTLIATNVYGTDTFVRPTYVHVHPLPVAPAITHIYPYLISSYSTGNQWYLNGNIISGANSQNHDPSLNGSYTVVYTDVYGCSATSAPYILSTASIDPLSTSKIFAIYPNPVSDFFTVQADFDTEELVLIKLQNISGQVIFEKEILAKNMNEKIDVSQLGAGIYILELLSGPGSYRQKLIVQ